ncbi:hypothetical protein KW785_01815 [Candidatus Parcubacteria bacterium]|nr:hypothetical protein [Candidatus Parcubacteria bacterium]
MEGIDPATIRMLSEEIGELDAFRQHRTSSGEKPLLFTSSWDKLRNLFEVLSADPERRFKLYRQDDWGTIEEITKREFREFFLAHAA